MEGGSERFCFNLSKNLQKLGHDIQIYTSKRRERPHQLVEGIPCTFFRNYRHMLGLNPLAIVYKYLKKGVDWADIVHAHSYIYFMVNQVALYRKKRMFPYILHLHGGLSNITSDVYGRKATLAKILYNGSFGKWTVTSADKVIACSEHDREQAVKKFDVDPPRIVHVPNSVYVDEFYTKPDNPPIVTFLGRLTRLKGCRSFPQIIQSVVEQQPKVKFWIVGDGPQETRLKRELKDLPVKFWGRIPNQQVPEVLSKSSVLFHPSLMEGSPLVCLEALASSVPVVASHVGGIPEVIKNGKTGYTVPIGDSDKMADRILRLVDHDSRRVKMGKTGRKIVERNHSWKVNTVKIEKIYRSILQ